MRRYDRPWMQSQKRPSSPSSPLATSARPSKGAVLSPGAAESPKSQRRPPSKGSGQRRHLQDAEGGNGLCTSPDAPHDVGACAGNPQGPPEGAVSAPVPSPGAEIREAFTQERQYSEPFVQAHDTLSRGQPRADGDRESAVAMRDSYSGPMSDDNMRRHRSAPALEASPRSACKTRAVEGVTRFAWPEDSPSDSGSPTLTCRSPASTMARRQRGASPGEASADDNDTFSFAGDAMELSLSAAGVLEASALRHPMETPKEAALRRKREAADREMARITEATIQQAAAQPVRPRPTGLGDFAINSPNGSFSSSCQEPMDHALPSDSPQHAGQANSDGQPNLAGHSPERQSPWHSPGCQSPDWQSWQSSYWQSPAWQSPAWQSPGWSTGSPLAFDEESWAAQAASPGSSGRRPETPREAVQRRKMEASDRAADRIRDAAQADDGYRAIHRRPSEPVVPEAGPIAFGCDPGRQAMGPGRPASGTGAMLAWEQGESGETPREAAVRRKREAADRDLQALKQKHAESAGNAREIAGRLRDSHQRTGLSPFATPHARQSSSGGDSMNSSKGGEPVISSPGSRSPTGSIAGRLQKESSMSSLNELAGHSVLTPWEARQAASRQQLGAVMATRQLPRDSSMSSLNELGSLSTFLSVEDSPSYSERWARRDYGST